MSNLYQIYMDDSGNVDPGTTNDPNSRYGSITAVILSQDYLDTTFNASFPKLVEKHFGLGDGGKPLNLHRRILNKPPDHGPFSVLKNDELRKAWDGDVLRMFGVADYVAITAAVDKVGWYYQHPTWNGDFYQVLVEAVLERTFYFLKNRSAIAEVNIETKNPGRDERLKARYRSCLTGNGFDYISADKLNAAFKSKELNIFRKDDCRPGGQLADLIAGPALSLIRHQRTGRHPVESDFVLRLCEILETSKFYREGLKSPDGYGKVWRPQSKS